MVQKRTPNIVFLTLSQTSPDFDDLQYRSFENTVGKGEIARNKQFLLFPQCLLPFFLSFLPVSSNLKIVVCNLFHFGRVQNLSFGKGLKELNDLRCYHFLL